VITARWVADGILTEALLGGLHLAIFLAKLNQFETWKTHFGNAYLEGYVQEKLYIFEGPEFGFQDGRIYITHKQFTA